MNIELTAPFDLSYQVLGDQTRAKRAIILLHGHGETAQTILDSFSALSNRYFLVAANGPFPLPKRREDHFIIRYSWYFYDPFTQKYLINQKFAANLITQLINHFKFSMPVTIIGFSQGGYLAPFIAQNDVEIDTVIGIGCVFRTHFFKKFPRSRFYGIHCKDDSIVEYDNAKIQFEELQNLGLEGEFISMASGGHQITEEIVAKISEILQ